MLASIRFVALSFVLVGAWSALGATGAVAVEKAPGTAAAAATVKGSGTIKAIDAETRKVTILGDGGNELSIVAGPEVKNFDRLAVGQRVNAEYTQALALELKPGSTAPVSRTVESATGGAAEGKSPAGVIGQRVRIVAEVVALNPETKTVTLKGPERTLDLPLTDQEQFARIKVGDRVEAVYVESMALAVSPAE